MRARRNTPLIHTCPQCGATKEWWASRLPYGLCAQCRARRKHENRDREYHRNYALVHKYDITIAERDRRLIEQGGRCVICHVMLSFAGRDGLHVDHDHATGRNRALLCGNCNRGLGCFMDSPEVLEAAASYLRYWSDINADTLDVRVDLSIEGTT